MIMKTPLQSVRDTHGSKQDLIEKIVPLLVMEGGESVDDVKRRLRNVSNRKLLNLLGQGEALKVVGGKDALVASILELKGLKKDADYRAKITVQSTGRLLDLRASLMRAAKRSN